MNDENYNVPRIEHDKVMMHMNFANRRMLIALLAVCITFIVTIVVFVSGYTHREQNWLNTLKEMQTHTTVTENVNGTQP